MYCPFCGVGLDNSPKFCRSCGQDISFINEAASTVSRTAGEDLLSSQIVPRANIILLNCLYELLFTVLHCNVGCFSVGATFNQSLYLSGTDACSIPAKSAVHQFMRYRELKEIERKSFSKSKKRSMKTVKVS